MRNILVAAMLVMASCTRSEPVDHPVINDGPRTPRALVGSWRRVAPGRLAGEVLTLNGDSTASGVILWDDTHDVMATHWSVRFGSRDSLAMRQDWRQGHRDGGDAECVLNIRPSGCISMPHLCIGARKERVCHVFVYVEPDSLLLPDGSRFVRQAPVPMVSLSQ